MCKRFADTGLWKQSWFVDLSMENKMVWTYLTSQCNTAGIWKLDVCQLKRDVGLKEVNIKNIVAELCNDHDPETGALIYVPRVLFISGGKKLWITGFISFQYEKGKSGVNYQVAAVKGAVNRLRDEGLLEYALKNGFIRINNFGAAFPASEEILKEHVICSEEETLIQDDSFVEEVSSVDDIISLTDFEGCQPLATYIEQEQEQERDKVPGSSCFVLKEEGGVGEETNPVAKLYLECWGRVPANPGELKAAEELLEQYGAEEFRFALRQALEHKKSSLAYIRGICRNRHDKAAAVKSREEALQKAEDLRQQVLTQRRKGVKLGLLQQVYGTDEPDVLKPVRT